MGLRQWHCRPMLPTTTSKGKPVEVDAGRVWVIWGEDQAGSPLIFGGHNATREMYSPKVIYILGCWFVGFDKPDVVPEGSGHHSCLLHSLGKSLLQLVLLPGVTPSLQRERGGGGQADHSWVSLCLLCHTGQQEGEGGGSPGCPQLQAGGGQHPAGWRCCRAAWLSG